MPIFRGDNGFNAVVNIDATGRRGGLVRIWKEAATYRFDPLFAANGKSIFFNSKLPMSLSRSSEQP